MLIPRIVVVMVSVTMSVSAGVMSGQDFPSRPIRIVTGSLTGTAGVMSRLIAERISVPLGQPVIVDNRGGLQQLIVLNASPDGYTLLLAPPSLWIGPLLQEMSYDPVRDFAPITMVGKTPSVLVVTPSLPVTSVKELIALAKAKPGELNYSSGPIGSSSHLAGALFASMASVNIVHVPYSSSSQQDADLISGRLQLTINSPASVMNQVKLGKLRALAVTSAEPSALAPGLPTIAASGLPKFETEQKVGMFAPGKTPKTIINRLNQEIVRFLKTAEAKEKFFNAGVEVISSSPEETAAAVKSDMTLWGKVIKDGGIKAN